MKHQIIPTIISKNQKELDYLIKKYEKYFNCFQIDIMDGKFVENKSNWFNLKLLKRKKYEAHLMINNPEEWIKENYNQFDVLIVNFEKVKKPLELIKFVKSKNKKFGFALNPETPIMLVLPYLKYLDHILILTVHPGMYGARFLIKTLNKIESLRMNYKGNIEVDGHINPKTIKLCKNNGANLFAIGSFLKKSKDMKKSIKEINNALR